MWQQTAAIPLDSPMSVHFGSFLTRARAVRGLTLEALAAAAQVSAGTISHAKNKAKCPWKPTVRHAVLRALHRRVALSAPELSEAVATGLIESEHVASEVLRVSDPSMRTLADTGQVRHAFKAFLQTCGSTEERVFATVGRLIAQLGSEQTANIIQAVAASVAAGGAVASTQLPIEEQERRLVFVDDITFENMRVKIYTPHKPQSGGSASTARKHA